MKTNSKIILNAVKEENKSFYLGPVHICRPTNLALLGPGTCPVIEHHNLGNQAPDKTS